MSTCLQHAAESCSCSAGGLHGSTRNVQAACTNCMHMCDCCPLLFSFSHQSMLVCSCQHEQPRADCPLLAHIMDSTAHPAGLVPAARTSVAPLRPP